MYKNMKKRKIYRDLLNGVINYSFSDPHPFSESFIIKHSWGISRNKISARANYIRRNAVFLDDISNGINEAAENLKNLDCPPTGFVRWKYQGGFCEDIFNSIKKCKNVYYVSKDNNSVSWMTIGIIQAISLE
jgi:hypothetical protein